MCVLEGNYELLEQKEALKEVKEVDKKSIEYNIKSFEKTRNDYNDLVKEHGRIWNPIAYGLYESYDEYVEGESELKEQWESVTIVSEQDYTKGVEKLKDINDQITQIRNAIFKKANCKIPFNPEDNDTFQCVSDGKWNDKGFKVQIMWNFDVKDSYMIKPDFKAYKARIVYDTPIGDN